ncbi:MAG: DUF4384 domain-containing protein [Oscillatoriales cyanobacterium RM2_1_1]|nr:DUF4384 domain-containing protein [Oscillatoriales cyanobacterium RM2_1_1]
MHQAAGQVEQLMGTTQQPQLYYSQQDSLNALESSLDEILTPIPVADGMIQAVETGSKTAKVWLGGLPPIFLGGYGANSILTGLPDQVSQSLNPVDPIDQAQIPQPQLLVRTPTGLTAKVNLLHSGGTETSVPALYQGQLLQETIRVLPRQVMLKVGLDPELTRIERVDATSAFSGVAQMGVVAGDQPADYILSRVQDRAIAQSPDTPLPSVSQGQYGLFSLGQVLIPNTLGETGEPVKLAIQRLIPHFKTRLALKLLSLTKNERSLTLKARVTFALLTPQSRVLIQRETPQARNIQGFQALQQELPNQPVQVGATTLPRVNLKPDQKPDQKLTQKLESDHPEPFANDSPELSQESLSAFPLPILTSQGTINLAVGSRVQYQIRNNSDSPIYFILFQLDSRGRTFLLDPTLTPSRSTANEPEPPQPPQQQQVAPGKTLSLPTANAYEDSSAPGIAGETLQGPPGLAETYLILSHSPFTQTLEAIAPDTKKGGGIMKLLPLSDPLTVAEALLQDLGQGSQPGVTAAGASTDEIALDINAWATFHLIYRVI